MAVQRRLAAILAADVAGYSRLMGEDEAGTRARFNARLNELIEPTIASHRGRLLGQSYGIVLGRGDHRQRPASVFVVLRWQFKEWSKNG